MIDYWEAMGRLATYKDLYSEFLKILPPVGMIPRVKAHLDAVHSTEDGLNIPRKQYEDVQDFLAPILTENYLSLMSAGELLWTFSFQESRNAMYNLLAITSYATPEVYGPSTRYFITLGLLIVDVGFRHGLKSKEPDAVQSLHRLSDRANDQVTNLANDPKFEIAASDLAKLPWDGGCNVSKIYWPGHLHPLGINTDTWKSGNGTQPANTGEYVVCRRINVVVPSTT